MRIGLAVLLVIFGTWQAGHGAWIQAKAWLAQGLISQAWSRTLQGERQAKPWPWADTWPVARLSVPRLGIERYVLAGAHGATLAFGPGHASSTVLPGEEGNSLIGGHRDTHLAFLADLRPGDEIVIERRDSVRVLYRVSDAQVVDRRDLWIATQQGPARLTLVTCYPLGAWRAGGDQRYVITAKAPDEAARRADRPAAAAPMCMKMPAPIPSAATVPARQPCVLLRPTR